MTFSCSELNSQDFFVSLWDQFLLFGHFSLELVLLCHYLLLQPQVKPAFKMFRSRNVELHMDLGRILCAWSAFLHLSSGLTI